ncbi:MAG: twin-arginine translocation signal domain-containing protein [Candidatus Gracilibacteria bacterium]|nr:twin-arginine translocation signal domain-containing protein [Candidatus Gracilibacteria bacterium]
MSRRDLLKRAAGAGLALTGLGGLVGCALTPNLDLDLKVAGRDFNKYDFDAIAREYETGKRQVIPINSIDDFALSGEELGWMRLSEGTEKRRRTSLFDPNPLKGNDDRFNLGSMIKGFPSCKKWLLIQYEGRTNYPRYPLDIIVNQFNSEENYLFAKEKLATWFLETKIPTKELKDSLKKKIKFKLERLNNWGELRKPYSKITGMFSIKPFLISIQNPWYIFSNINGEQEQEQISRLNLYQKKRGLDLVWSDFEEIQPFSVTL